MYFKVIEISILPHEDLYIIAIKAKTTIKLLTIIDINIVCTKLT